MKSLLQLVRLPNVFTVVADILMGYLFVHPSLTPPLRFACVMAASICLYWAGMVLNDVFDVEQDRRERPERPLPSGTISLRFATRLGWTLLMTGVALGCLAGHLGTGVELPWRSGVVAVIVAVCVVGYDGFFKQTFVGPILMGACRAGNILLGMSTGAIIHDYATPLFGFDAAQLAVAGGLGIFVAGITWFARDEATAGSRWNLVLGGVVMLLGWGLLGSTSLQIVCQAGRYDLTMPHDIWPLAVLFLTIPIIRRVILVVSHPTPDRIQVTVRMCLLSLIVLDAAVCMLVRTPWWWSVGILSLLVPTICLGRWFYST